MTNLWQRTIVRLLRTSILTAAIATVLLGLVGCGDGDGRGGSTGKGGGSSTWGTHFAEARVYKNWLFDNQEACDAFNLGQPITFNCFQLFEVSAEGQMVIILTDIVNTGTYSISQDSISCVLDGPGDAPSTFAFEILDHGSELKYECRRRLRPAAAAC